MVAEPQARAVARSRDVPSQPRLRIVADGGQQVVGHPGTTTSSLSPAPVQSISSAEKIESIPGCTATAITRIDFRTLYDTHLRLVRASLSRLGVPEEDLMDLTQKVFLTAYLKLPGFEGRSLLSTWLWSISRRVAIAHRRSGPKCHEVATDPSVFEHLTEQPGNVTSGGEATLLAHASLSKLTETQRVVFLLFVVEQMNCREIAAALNIPLGTVRSRLRYAREFLQREAGRLKPVRKVT